MWCKRGRLFSPLAQQYGVSARLLQKLNQAPTDGALVPGQTLVVLLPERTHVVRRGDTVWSIAREHGISTRELYQNNIFLQGQGALIPGEELILSLQDVHRVGSLGVNGYAYPFINGDLLRQVLPYMTYATPFTYGIGADGGLVALRDEGILAAAGQYSVLPVDASVHHDGGGTVLLRPGRGAAGQRPPARRRCWGRSRKY